MKKVLSLILAALLMLTLLVPAFAAEDATTRSTVPTILIAGDGDPLYDADNKRLFRPSEILNYFGDKAEEDDGDSEIIDSVVNVLKPFLFEGILLDQWDNYYEKLQEELTELFSDIVLDNNGEVVNGTGISNARKSYMEKAVKTNKADKNGTYGMYDYRFWYDWRLDPVAVADDFNDYIEAVKKVTGKDKVAIVGRCLGTSVVLAYVEKYGTDSIHGIAFYGSVAAGAEILSEPISGKFAVDGNAINRTLADFSETLDIHPFINATIDLIEKSGVIDGATDIVKRTIYYKVVKGVTSALALSTFYTWPNYWAAVSSEDYEEAMLYVFGDEGSAKRTKYAGLIEKIEGYDTLVRDNLTALMKSFGEKDIWYGDVRMGRCTLSHHGMNNECSPFLKKEFPNMAFDVRNSQMTEEEAYIMCYSMAGGKWGRKPGNHAVMDYYKIKTEDVKMNTLSKVKYSSFFFKKNFVFNLFIILLKKMEKEFT